MVKPEKFGHLHLVYHFTVPLRNVWGTMFFDKDASGRIQWTLELKLIDISNNSSVPCLLRTCLDKKTRYLEHLGIWNKFFAPMDNFLSLSRTVVKTYSKNSNIQCFDSIFVQIFTS